MKIIGISLNEKGRMYYFSPNNLNIMKGMAVIVETERGFQYGVTQTEISDIDSKKIRFALKNVIRIANNDDKKQNDKNVEDSKKAMKKCNQLVDKYKLPMKILEASYTFDRDKLVFKFLSDNRVDFRELAKELASIYKTRIELRQIGVRDKAKEVGGIGVCGRPFCCSNFLNEFDAISINMAKNQNMSLNPTKINGTCGRLLCCLNYENDCYSELKKGLPVIGRKVKTGKGEGTVISVNILKQTYRVDIPNFGIVEESIKHES